MPEQAESPERRQPGDSRRPTLRALIAARLGVIVLLAAAGICLSSDRSPRAVTLAVSARSADRDEQLRRLAVGTWRDFYQGVRTLSLRPDGTATMVVELTGMKARLFTPRLELQIVWSIEHGKMRRRTVGGRPAEKIAFVNQRAGVAVAEPILRLGANRMILLDQAGSRKYTWRRVR